MTASKFGNTTDRDWTRPTGRMPMFWSFSRLSVFEKCALKYALQHIWKLKQPLSFAMERGSDIHAKSEEWLKGNIKGIPDELMQFREAYQAIIKMDHCKAEESYTVTKTWQPTHATDWDNAWLRAKVDIEILEPGILSVIDVKTGKKWPEHEAQAAIYGTLGFVIHPKVEQVDFEYWYVDSGEVGHYEFGRAGLREQKKEWRARSNKMLKTKRFDPNPTKDNCKYCPFRSDKEMVGGEAGPCDAWKAA